jgi:hypothetical protein
LQKKPLNVDNTNDLLSELQNTVSTFAGMKNGCEQQFIMPSRYSAGRDDLVSM